MKHLLWTLLAGILLAALSLPALAAPLPLAVDRFEIDDIELLENQVNRLDVQRNGEYEVEVKFTPTQDIRNLQLKVFASGFEYSDVSPIESTSRVFDADTNVSYVRRFRLKLSDQLEEDDYKIRIMFTDRFNNELTKNYNVKFDVPRHGLKVEDIVFYPAGAVQAGHALLTTVRLENQGERVENDIRVEVSIPALGISGTDYIDEIRAGGNREKGTEEIFMRIPDCAKPGPYEVLVKATYNQLHDTVTGKDRIDVLENPACTAPKKPAGPETIVILKQSPPAGEAGQPQQGQAPQSTPGKTAEQSTSAESGSKDQSGLSKVRTVLESVLLILVALLVIVGIIVAFKGLNREEAE